ncbi:MAG: hypothetical protein IKL13_07495 [Clostridia bacterium]|nr:hypothetical protein [Clostridia bacterium]
MKNYDDLTNRLLERRNRYVAEQKKKKQVIARTTVSVGSVALVSLASFALFKSDAFRETPPISDGGATTTTTHIPTEGEATTTTTTTVNTTAPAPTTDGGIVTPPTTAPTTTAPAPSKPTATQAPTTGKTEPSKTTTSTTAPTDKLLITGVEAIDDDTLDQMPIGLFKPGEISPLLKQAMEQYKDTDAVYAVLVAINPKYNQKLVEDLNEAVDALLQSDEMVKLAEEVQLAWGEYEAAGLKWSAGETYRSLRSQYDSRQHDFKLAYWNARADEAVEALAKFSDIEPIPLEGRWKEDLEKNEKAVLSYVLSAAYGTKKSDGSLSHYGYAAVLSADEILELSECGSYMFWLDSYDEEAYMDYLNDWV